jgi:hypothetical protein
MINLEAQRCFEGPSPIRLTTEELATILESAEVVHSEPTSVAGMVRILNVDGTLYVQEQTPDGQILLRPRPDIEHAMAFVERRRSAYERMWDG